MLAAILLTLFFPLLAAFSPMVKCGNARKLNFLSKEYTDVLKGLCCIVVVYVHVKNGNPLQDAIGSFAYVCVTLFFLFSSYGMLLSVEKKKEYLAHFWRNRLVALLVPLFFINLASFAAEYMKDEVFAPGLIYSLNGYVRVLLEFCLWFYIVESAKKKWFPRKNVLGDLLLIAGVVVSSLFLYLFVEAEFSAQNGWPFERIGLVWGILLYRYQDRLTGWMGKHRLLKTLMLFIICGCLGVMYLKFKMVYFFGEYILKIVLGLALIIFLFVITEKRFRGNRISSWLGDVSYEVYLSHGIVMSLIVFSFPNMNSGLFIFLTICVVLLFSTLVHLISKPIVKLLRT